MSRECGETVCCEGCSPLNRHQPPLAIFCHLLAPLTIFCHLLASFATSWNPWNPVVLPLAPPVEAPGRYLWTSRGHRSALVTMFRCPINGTTSTRIAKRRPLFNANIPEHVGLKWWWWLPTEATLEPTNHMLPDPNMDRTTFAKHQRTKRKIQGVFSLGLP